MNANKFIETANAIMLGSYETGKVVKTIPLTKEEKAVLKKMTDALAVSTSALIDVKNTKEKLKAMVGLRLDMFDAHQEYGFNPETGEVELYEQE